MSAPKVICIGWHKTGTSTMGDALLMLDYKVVGAREDLAYSLLEGDTTEAIELAGQFDALQDVPWAPLFKELDMAYPGSKFILTIRDELKWLNSAKKHFKDTDILLHKWIYGDGVLAGNEALYLNRFRQHYSEVEKYFRDRPNDLLVMNFENGDGWEKLCDFLKMPVPKKPFPHSNKGMHSYSTKDKFKHTLRALIPKPVRHLRVAMLESLGLHTGKDRFNNAEQNRTERKIREKV